MQSFPARSNSEAAFGVALVSKWCEKLHSRSDIVDMFRDLLWNMVAVYMSAALELKIDEQYIPITSEAYMSCGDMLKRAELSS